MKSIFILFSIVLATSVVSQTPEVEYVTGSTVKISQLVGEYGPYQFDELATGTDSTTTLYYTLSTWNPYTVMLMKSTLKLSNSPVSRVADFAVPSGFHLQQNVPNPFNPVTTIRFSLPRQQYVKLQIFNMQGQNIATPVDGLFVPGAHAVLFEGRDLTSGVYLYRLDAGEHVQCKKMLLIK
ncbi:MAG: T9SS type A sorting domain-containing protein [candidate division KSB1 bacterium]|nr:T9SS type A sorting domain-containing protein [candidate division KSB1 bacterium]